MLIQNLKKKFILYKEKYKHQVLEDKNHHNIHHKLIKLIIIIFNNHIKHNNLYKKNKTNNKFSNKSMYK